MTSYWGVMSEKAIAVGSLDQTSDFPDLIRKLRVLLVEMDSNIVSDSVKLFLLCLDLVC